MNVFERKLLYIKEKVGYGKKTNKYKFECVFFFESIIYILCMIEMVICIECKCRIVVCTI